MVMTELQNKEIYISQAFNHMNVVLDIIIQVILIQSDAGMYSFCLKPGEHQPSGTCNFSRIDNARLVLNLTGPSVVKENKKGQLTAQEINIFALNYNVLRIMSGMGGLAYSN